MPRKSQKYRQHETPQITEGPAERLRAAAEEAKKILGGINDHDQEALIQATLLQGVAAGDIIAASITQKLRLQRENLRLKQRIARTKLQIERQKLKAAIALNKPQRTPQDIREAIAEIYGLNPPKLMTA